MSTYTIGQIAMASGVPTSTVRYYERRGIMLPTTRSSGNYRLFDEGALDRLRFIRSAQSAGFTLADITELLTLKEDQPAPCDEVQTLIGTRLVEVEEQINHLRAVNSMLREWLKVCRCAQSSGRCGVISGLESLKKKKCTKAEKTA